MTNLTPIDVLNEGKAKLVKEKTALELKIKEIVNTIAEYDYLIEKAESLHIEPEEQTFEFVESDSKPIAPGECTTELNGLKYCKKADQITIRNDKGKCVNASWEYLLDYYSKLPEETRFTQITGINKDKRALLMVFFENHPNFNCIVSEHANSRGKVLIKIDVTVNNDTKPMQRVIDVN